MTLHVAAKRSRAAWPLFATCLVMCLVMCLSLAGPSALSAMLKHIEVVTPRIGQRGTTHGRRTGITDRGQRTLSLPLSCIAMRQHAAACREHSGGQHNASYHHRLLR